MNNFYEPLKTELTKKYSREWLNIDSEVEVNKICKQLQKGIFEGLHKQGGVVGISGGIDSSIVLALMVKAIGADRVLGVLLPEKESDPESSTLAQSLAKKLGVMTVNENISDALDGFGCYKRRDEAIGADRVLGVLLPEKESDPESSTLAQNLAKKLGVMTVNENISDALDGFGCYKRRDEAINRVIPEYHQPGWAAKIVLPPNLLDQSTLNFYSLVVTSPDGQEISKRLPKAEFQQIVAASNFKQRSRMCFLYFHAEAHNYAVIGTANKNEHDLGFFVKWGDGGVDISPIEHLFKTQVYQIAQFLNIPQEIQTRIPTTDTYPGGSTQEEFFYRIPFDILDTVWLGYERGVSADEIARVLDLQTEQVSRVIADIQSKIHATNYLRTPPLELDQY